MEVQNRHLKPKQGGYFSEKGGLLALCNTNSSLLAKPMSRSSAAVSCSSRTDTATDGGSLPIVNVECNNSVSGGVKATAVRNNSLAATNITVDKSAEELEMVHLRSSPTKV